MSDFAVQPNSQIDEEPIFDTIVTEFENLVEQRRSNMATPLRRWRLTYTNRSESQFSTVKNFFITKKGKYGSFTWTNPNDSTEYTVRFEEDSLIFRRQKVGLWNFDFVLREVR